MRFAQMQRGERYTKKVMDFSGGLNTRELPARLDDDTLPDCLNVYWKEGALRTRPALQIDGAVSVDGGEMIAAFETADGEYRFIYTEQYVLGYYRNVLVFSTPTDNAGARSQQHVLFAEGGQNDVMMFVTEKRDGTILRRTPYRITLEEEHTRLAPLLDEYYVPLVFVNGRGSNDRLTVGSMTMYEGFNLLTNAYRAQWTTDGQATYFRPPFAVGNGAFRVVYTHTDGAEYTFSVSVSGSGADSAVKSATQDIPDLGEVYLQVGTLGGECSFRMVKTHEAVALPDVGFSGNLAVYGRRRGADVAAVTDMSFSAWYGGGNRGGTRLFLGGCADAPHLVRYSDVDNPLYFPENNYLYVGDRTQAVTAFAKQNDVLVIFKEREIYYCTYAYEATEEAALAAGETVDVTAAAYFPLTQLHPAVGCDLPYTVQLCGNRLVWATREGAVYMLSALNAWSEKAVRCLSYTVTPTLKTMLTGEAYATRYHGNYLLFCGREVMLFDYASSGFSGFAAHTDDKKAGAALSWYRWQLPCAVTQVLGRDDTVMPAFSRDDDLAVGRFVDGACDSDGIPINSRVVTKPFDCGADNRRKAIRDLWIQLADTGATVQVSLYGDGASMLPYALQTVHGDGDTVSAYGIPCRQARVRTLGVVLESDEPIALVGMTMQLHMLGSVR